MLNEFFEDFQPTETVSKVLLYAERGAHTPAPAATFS